MAIVKSVNKSIKAHQYVADTIAYVLSPENKHGDEKCFKATCLNCVNDGAASLAKQFYWTRKAFDKDNKILAHHYVQSFSPNENITPELAHQIGVELMQKVAPNFQVIISTHVDKDHIHNHIIINSVNMETGVKWKGNQTTVEKILWEESNKLSKQYGLTIIEKHSGFRGIDQSTQKLAEKGQSWKVDLCKALDEATEMCITKEDFISYMKDKGFDIPRYTDRHITFQKIGETKKIRADTLAEQFGEIYKKENLEKKMGFYIPPAPISTPQRKRVQSPFITEFERFEKDYFSKNPPLAKVGEAKKLQHHIRQSSNPLMALLLIIFRLVARRRKYLLDKRYHTLRRYNKVQRQYKKYQPSLAEQVKRIERLQKTAGNIPYKTLVSSQGENCRMYVALEMIPRLYAYGFFFSAKLYKDYAIVTVKEIDKTLLQKAMNASDEILEEHNSYFKEQSDYADLKKRAEQIGSKIEYLVIKPAQLKKLADETDRFVKFEDNGKIRIAFLSENKNFILRSLYPDKYKANDLFSVSRNSKVNTRLKSEILLGGQKMMYRTLSREQVEQLAENTKGQELFAVFNKNAKGESLGEDKYNVAFKSGDEEKIETALKSDTKPKRRI